MEYELSYHPQYDMMASTSVRWECSELNELNVFVQAAEAMSFTGAAQRLHISQPAVSMQISNLEKRLNTLLFDRSGRSIRLTEAADALLPMAREILNYRNPHRGGDGLLARRPERPSTDWVQHLGGRYVLPHLIARFRQLHPQVRVTVGICAPEGAVDQVCDGRAQLSILSSEIGCRDVEYRPFFSRRVSSSSSPPTHPWAAEGSIKPRQLIGQPFILREELSGTRRVMQAGLLEHDVRIADLNTVMVLGSAEAIVTAVEAGIGIAYVSRIVAARAISVGHVVEVKVEGLNLSRQLHMIRHSRRAQTHVQSAFWDFCHSKENREFLDSLT